MAPLRQLLTRYFLCVLIAAAIATPVPTGAAGNTVIAPGPELSSLPASPGPVPPAHSFKAPPGSPEPDFSKTIEELELELDESTLRLQRAISRLAGDKGPTNNDFASIHLLIDEIILKWLHVEYTIILILSGEGVGGHKPQVGDRMKLQTRIEMALGFCSLMKTKTLDSDHPGKLRDPRPKEEPGLSLFGKRPEQMEQYKEEFERIKQACADNRCPHDPPVTAAPAPVGKKKPTA
ncbi:hypothetical protein H0H93_015498, partial [Arthromyces matolae]